MRRTLDSAPRAPDMQHEMTVVWRWIEHALTPDEYHHVVTNTGWISEEELEDLTRPPPAKPGAGDGDDEVPF